MPANKEALGWGPTREDVALTVAFALIAHQVFRRNETYSIRVHASRLLLPPSLVALLSVRSTDPAAIAAALWFFVPAYLSVIAVSVLIYRLSPFHPLARYPGPLLCKLSKFSYGFLSIGGRSHIYVKHLHEHYGDVVRIGPNELSIRDHSVIPALLGSSGVPKGPLLLGKTVDYSSIPMIALQDTDLHLSRRRPWARAFTPSVIKEYSVLIEKRTRQLISRLEEQQGVVRLDEWIDAFTYDFMSDMAFGSGPELLATRDKNNFWSILSSAVRIAVLFGSCPWIGAYLRHLPPAVAPMKALISRCSTLAQERIARGSSSRDLFHFLNHEDQPDDAPPPLKQLADDGILAMVAGADTVASALTSLFACILAHPRVYTRLQQEIDACFPPGADPLDASVHREMAYLDAVVNETLRLFPPIPSCTQRCVPHDGPAASAGSIYLPPGTAFWVHAYSMHRDTRNFSNPDTFWPERWLLAATYSAAAQPQDTFTPATTPMTKEVGEGVEEPAPDEFRHNVDAFMPFSHGPMKCVGKRLAHAEIRAVVCGILQRFRMRAAEGARGHGEKGEGEEGQGVLDLAAYERGFLDFFITVRAPVRVVLEVQPVGGHEGGV